MSDSPTLTLERVDRNHAGTYQCLADNGVRDAVHVDIELTVLCKYNLMRHKIKDILKLSCRNHYHIFIVLLEIHKCIVIFYPVLNSKHYLTIIIAIIGI